MPVRCTLKATENLKSRKLLEQRWDLAPLVKPSSAAAHRIDFSANDRSTGFSGMNSSAQRRRLSTRDCLCQIAWSFPNGKTGSGNQFDNGEVLQDKSGKIVNTTFADPLTRRTTRPTQLREGCKKEGVENRIDDPVFYPLNRFKLSLQARSTGLEPATTGSTVRYSNQLSYDPSHDERHSLREQLCAAILSAHSVSSSFRNFDSQTDSEPCLR